MDEEFFQNEETPLERQAEPSSHGISCGGCGNRLARSLLSQPPIEWSLSAKMIFGFGILAGVIALIMAMFVGRLALGLAVTLWFGICGAAYCMPKVRTYRCWKCGWKQTTEFNSD